MSIATGPVPAYPDLREVTAVFARIGCLGFGGPAGQIALMHRELVARRRWISETRFLHALNYCMLLPGPEAQQLAIYIGWLLHGTRGGVIAGVLFVLPGFAVIVALSAVYALFGQTDWLAGVFFGLKAAVLAIVVEAVLRVGRRALKSGLAIILAVLAFLALFAFSVPFPAVVLAAGLVGFLGVRLRPASVVPSATEAAAQHLDELPSVIDNHVAQVAPSWASSLRVAAIWVGLWALPWLALVPVWGWSNTFTTLLAFFSQMAVVTFGGAYAVLSYVAVEAVQTFGWLRAGEMIDGLALAETTPGPLVLVLTFVGFMAGFRSSLGLDPFWGGVLGAVLTTWVTFVPCFLWIFLGAPFIERLRSNVALSAALAAITAAVVGVILNLALWFGLHVLFRQVGTAQLGWLSVTLPEWQSFDPAAAALSVLAALMLFAFRQGMIRTLGVCALAGFAYGALT